MRRRHHDETVTLSDADTLLGHGHHLGVDVLIGVGIGVGVQVA
jgi:hypothetical protein